MSNSENHGDKNPLLKDRNGDGFIDLPPVDDFHPHGISPEKKEELDRLFGEDAEEVN